MKRILYFAFILVTASCNNEIMEFEEFKNPETTIQPKTRSINEAIEIANNAAQEFFGVTRAAGGRNADINNVDIITSSLTRSSGSNDTLLYIVNYEDNNGFAVISANKDADALLAVTEQGSYTPDSENIGFNMFMDMAQAYAAKSILPPGVEEGGTLFPIKEYKETFDTIANITVLPKVEVQWGQTGVEGRFAINPGTSKYAGCANTATAQIMSYFCYPTQIDLTYLRENVRTLHLNWEEIKRHNVWHYSSCLATTEAHNAISYLHRELGYINFSEYNLYSTSTFVENVKIPFDKYEYITSEITNYNNNSDFASLLDENKLIYMVGRTSYDGHAWIVDGGKKFIMNCYSWTRTLGNDFWELLSMTTTEIEYYHHNWGWDGSCNGYFNKNVFATNEGFEYDNTGNLFDNNIDCNFNYSIRYFWVTR